MTIKAIVRRVEIGDPETYVEFIYSEHRGMLNVTKRIVNCVGEFASSDRFKSRGAGNANYKLALRKTGDVDAYALDLAAHEAEIEAYIGIALASIRKGIIRVIG